jgi:serine/threonine-protein kinase
MAVVYLAHDLRHDRKVALKVLRPELAATLGAERFLREVKIAASLTHPHILPVHDSGEADGFLYYVMPYIEGESLRGRLVREGELPVSDVARILHDLVDALAHAHRKGVVHRDIKPENVMLSEGHALVTDFGIAKAVSEATGRPGMTTGGVALGTPAYMAPEQAAAEPAIDQRADLYAVGVVAYELLTGRPPFTGTTSQQVLAAHVTEAPVPIAQRRPSVPRGMAQLVMKCLEKKPADRWQRAEELLGPLEAAMTPAAGTVPTTAQPAVGSSGQRRATLLTLGMLAVVLVAGAGWWAAHRPSSRAVRRLAVLPLENASGDSTQTVFADGMTRAVIEVLTEARVPATGQNRWAHTFAQPVRAVLTLQRQIARDIAHQVAANLGSADESKFQPARQVAPAAYAELVLGRAEQNRFGNEGWFTRARAHFERAIQIDSLYGSAWAELANTTQLAYWFGLIPESVADSLVLQSARRALALDSTAAAAHAALGAFLFGKWDIPAAERQLRRANELSADPGVRLTFADFLALTGRVDEAMALDSVNVVADPRVATYRQALGVRLWMSGRADQALLQLDSTIAIDPLYADAVLMRSLIRTMTGQVAGGLEDLERGEPLTGVRMPALRATILALAGRRNEARQALAEVDSLLRTVNGGSSPVAASPLSNNQLSISAPAWLALGDTARALANLERAAAVREPFLMNALAYPTTAPLRSNPRFQSLRARVLGLR